MHQPGVEAAGGLQPEGASSTSQNPCNTETVKHQMGAVEHQNVTLSLPADVLREVRHIAVDEGVSLSRFVALLLEREVLERRQYQAARRRQTALLDEGLPLGTNGRATWSRLELHER